MLKNLLVTIILLHVSITVLAHDGSDHTSDLEIWISALGIVAIILAIIYSLWWKNPDRKKPSKNAQRDTEKQI